jgi:hypothetical protein
LREKGNPDSDKLQNGLSAFNVALAYSGSQIGDLEKLPVNGQVF